MHVHMTRARGERAARPYLASAARQTPIPASTTPKTANGGTRLLKNAIILALDKLLNKPCQNAAAGDKRVAVAADNARLDSTFASFDSERAPK